MNRLTGVEEFLDGALEDPSVLAANLRDLTRLNRLTGGAGLSVRAVRSLLPDGGTVLDVGTGAADIPIGLLRDAERRGVGLAVTATDGRQEVLDAAIAVHPGLTRLPGLTLGHADGRRLAWADDTFDIAHVSLVLHHLDPDEAVDLLAELRRVARIGVVVNDLVRGRLAWLGAWLLTHTVAASRYTRHDGPMSVRRAYTRAETAALVEAAGLVPVAGFTGIAGHRYAIAAVRR